MRVKSSTLTDVVDSHLHIWDPSRLRYPWIESDPELDRPFTQQEYHAGHSGVSGIVFVQAGCLDEQGLDEVAWVEAVAAEGRLPIEGIVAFAPLEDAARRGAWLDALSRYPRVVGIRRLLQSEPAEFFDDPELIAGLADLAQRGLSFDACVAWHQLPALATLLHRVPELRVVIDHLGKPPVASGWTSADARVWQQSIDDLARIERVQMKLSGLGGETPQGTDLDSVAAPFIASALDAFGPERCMVGSDWPVSTKISGPRTYDDWFELVLDRSGLAGDERTMVASGAAVRFYGLGDTQR
ncbi:MAG: hypothetical protein JWN09_269 [Microbacteriaceae bacterium]|nr:hypothetical protein [Microbacteriaceae bacterium]